MAFIPPEWPEASIINYLSHIYRNGNYKILELYFSNVSLMIVQLNVLEYIHKSGYVHADIKGSNILLGFGKGNESQINLVDFGLAARYTTESVYKPDPKKKHNGTIEYTSRDAHDGGKENIDD